LDVSGCDTEKVNKTLPLPLVGVGKLEELSHETEMVFAD
jgi:hypothetical protein